MTSLMDIVACAQDPTFIMRVKAAASVLGIPFHPNQAMYVAARVNLSDGVEGVTDDSILALLAPEDVQNAGPEVPSA